MEYEQAFIVAGFALVLVRHGGGACGVVVGWVLGVLRFFTKCDAKKVVQGSEDGVRGAPWQRSSRDLISWTSPLDISKHGAALHLGSYSQMKEGLGLGGPTLVDF